ncbi:MAG: hypothetical protein GY796_22025 [Chloroflexi bacterium]|nr:hypothetical protein [Chloroflexota bacterium]
MILVTAKQHFDDDMNRAQALWDHAAGLDDEPLKNDILRAVWMMSVGACDAFFCDAYADIVSRTLRAKNLQSTGRLPNRLGNLKVPVVAILNREDGWRWRMAARELVENENVLSIEKIRGLMNLFCRDNHKLMNKTTIGNWMDHVNARQRMFGVARNNYRRANQRTKTVLQKSAVKQLEKRMAEIFQRRHDCIHNCDRPRTAPQIISVNMVEKAKQDICFLVERCCEHMRAEFTEYLRTHRFIGATRNQVGA